MKAIVGRRLLRPSRARRGSKDVRYGNGQYLTDIAPGRLSRSQLSRALVGIPFLGQRFTHFVAIEIFGLQIIHCRPGVFLVPNDFALSLIGRIGDFGESGRE
jgi:hypothetical protein